MSGHLVAIGLGSALLAGLMTWAVARRYGRRHALAVPLLALLASGYMIWRAYGSSAPEAPGVVALALLFIGPSVAGSLLGLVLARGRYGGLA